jgi:hypothetical protein
MLHSFVIFLSVLGFTWANENQLYALDLDKLHKLQKDNMEHDSFFHTQVFFDAIHSGKRTVKINSIKETIDTDATKSYDALSKQALHKTTTTIDLLPNKHYFSLDTPRILKNIQSIGEDYIVHCNSNDVRVGDYYIGTSNSEHTDVKTHSNNGVKQGFTFSREVTSINDSNIINGSRCRRMETALVHPLQIMNTRIESKITFPYNRVIVPRKLPERDAFTQPDSPLLLCDDEDVTSRLGSIHKADSKSTTLRGIPVDFGYALDVNGNECVDIAATVPGSINFNHGSGLNAIRKNIALAGGVTCTNCYAFVGAGVLAVFNIFGGNMATFAFEAKDEGGMGYNLDLLISNPSFSASKYIKLAGDGAVSSIPIAYGLALDINFGGAWATIKGSGSAKGQATFSSGYTLNEEDYIMYAKSRWTSEHSLINSNRITPTYTNKGLSLSTASLTAIISLSTRIHFSLGGSIPVINVGASVEFSTVLTATSQFIRSGKKYSLSLSFDDASQRMLTARENVYSPEDTIYFNVDYAGLNANEDHELYFNIHKYAGFNASYGTGYPIKLYKFKSSKTGDGSLKVDWKVPHDSKFMQKYRDAPHIHFSVHSSARLDRAHTSKNAKLVHKRSTTRNAVFKSPKKGDTIFVSDPITIQWDPNSLKYFDYYKGTDGLGVEKVPEAVDLLIVSVESKMAYELANDVANTGSYSTTIPESLLKKGKRFFLVIHDANEYSRMAWHNGNFELKKRPKSVFRFRRVPDKKVSNSNSSEDLPPANVEPPTIEFDVPLWNNTLLFETRGSVEQRGGHIQRNLAGPKACPPQGAALSVLLQMEFGFDGFNVMGRHFALGSTSSSPFIIIPQTNFCV